MTLPQPEPRPGRKALAVGILLMAAGIVISLTGIYAVAASERHLDNQSVLALALLFGMIGAFIACRRWWVAVLVLTIYAPVLYVLWLFTGLSVGCSLGLSCL